MLTVGPEPGEMPDGLGSGLGDVSPTIFSRRDILGVATAFGLTTIGGGAFWGLLDAMVAKGSAPARASAPGAARAVYLPHHPRRARAVLLHFDGGRAHGLGPHRIER